MKRVYLNTPEEVIKALKEGKEIKDEDGCSYKLVEGFIVHTKGNNFIIGDNISNVYNHPYILEEEPLKIEVGKFYKTRSGEKARCFFKCVNGSAMFSIDGYDTILNTNSNGECLQTGEEYQLDIIGPWEE